jgi:hypothetical protein
MAFDKATRNRLSNFVADAREVLVDEFTRQFQAAYGLDPKTGSVAEFGTLSHLDNSQRETARLLRETLAHYAGGQSGSTPSTRTKLSLERMVREQAFTVLNRLAALRMAEARGFLLESVANGHTSRGFQLYRQLAGHALGETGDAYRHYLFSLFDELSAELPVLFDRSSTQSLLFPREAALISVLGLINSPELEAFWAEDETIGWIYQYYNDPNERKKMRKESAAPRNSRELAVRNQFFTPRYVVEFLTDNTLGRIWYEMHCGQTRLDVQCSYLIRRPTEVFLAEGESIPEMPDQEGRSREALLRQPAYIRHRPLKDPREIRLLDPACGSMHFGLYAFDLFETIYEEAWDGGSCPSLQSSYTSKCDFINDVPRLIIEHNIHGIDIDPRAVQIAGLSLWLRAQKAWQARGVMPGDRPSVRRSNIVCAEPMPGSLERLHDFVTTLESPLLGELVKTVFEKMQLAGEAGSLLKIEEELRGAIETARKSWEKVGSAIQPLFSARELNRTLRPGAQQELSGIERALAVDHLTLTVDFWDTAEQRVLDALRSYAEQADAGSYQRRLFADDAARGFAFIDLCRKRYDAVVMNPPFGDSPAQVKAYLKKRFGLGRPDAYMCFVFRMQEVLHERGRCGAITSRTFLTLQFFDELRKLLLGGALQLDSLIDLGSGVLDGATVETCAYCSEKGQIHFAPLFFNLVDRQSINGLHSAIENVRAGTVTSTLFPTPREQIATIPGRVFAYRMVPSVRRAFAVYPPIDSEFAMEVQSPRTAGKFDVHVRQGLIPGDQFRFSRLATEVPYGSSSWKWAAKGGDYAKFLSLEDVLVLWQNDGTEIKMYAEICYGGASRTIKNEKHFFHRGISFPRVSSVGLNARVLPENSLFTDTGMAVLIEDPALRLSILGYLNSRLADYCCNSLHPGRKYEIAHLSSLPVAPELLASKDLIENTAAAIRLTRRLYGGDEDLPHFVCPNRLPNSATNVRRNHVGASAVDAITEMAERQIAINRAVYQCYEITEEDQEVIAADLFQAPGARMSPITQAFLNPELKINENVIGERRSEASSLTSYLLGAAFGRWDIRYATGDRQPPELPDPFAQLPICPPGMLQSGDGLPAEPRDVPVEYPLRVSWPGILVDDADHSEDIVARVREAIKVIWKLDAEGAEQDTCDALGVKFLREYFRPSAAFFADHLKRYSKSHRQAPIYWPLSTKSGEYTLWLYYQRLTEQTLYACVNDFVEPKIKSVTADLAAMRAQLTRTAKEEREFARLSDLEFELKDLRDELLRVAKFWKPNQNDGVQITAAPLWSCFNLKPWQNALKVTWNKLEQGDFDWAHLACSIWPERVLRKCCKDRSLAIAHDVEYEFWLQSPIGSSTGKKVEGRSKSGVGPKPLSSTQLDDLVHRLAQDMEHRT